MNVDPLYFKYAHSSNGHCVVCGDTHTLLPPCAGKFYLGMQVSAAILPEAHPVRMHTGSMAQRMATALVAVAFDSPTRQAEMRAVCSSAPAELREWMDRLPAHTRVILCRSPDVVRHAVNNDGHLDHSNENMDPGIVEIVNADADGAVVVWQPYKSHSLRSCSINLSFGASACYRQGISDSVVFNYTTLDADQERIHLE